MDNDETQRALARAKYYFEHVYKDRGMVKWNGYYLSDHTEDVAKYSAVRSAERSQKAMPEMSMETISKILFQSYTKKIPIKLQIRKKSIEGLNSKIITGIVNGVDETTIYVDKLHVDLTEILWVALRN